MLDHVYSLLPVRYMQCNTLPVFHLLPKDVDLAIYRNKTRLNTESDLYIHLNINDCFYINISFDSIFAEYADLRIFTNMTVV